MQVPDLTPGSSLLGNAVVAQIQQQLKSSAAVLDELTGSVLDPPRCHYMP